MSVPRDPREREEYVLDKLRAMLPRARQILEEMADSPNKRRAAQARKLLDRYREQLEHPRAR